MARSRGSLPSLSGNMRTAALACTAMSATALTVLLVSCRNVEVTRLYAVHADGGQSGGALEYSLPLELRAGGGHVSGKNRRLEELEVDTDPVHGVSASCHHGPPVTDPLSMEIRASYTDRDLVIEVRWEDSTLDPHPMMWRRHGDEWLLDGEDEDGIAILWTRGGGPFGCQEACHMSDFAVRGGSVIDLRAMRLAGEGPPEEAWVWKSSSGARELLLGGEGFATVAGGQPYRRVNSAVAADTSLRPEARRAGTFGEEDRPLWDGEGKALEASAGKAPAYLFASAGEAPLLTARAERWGKGWKVVFTRPLKAGEGRQDFLPGGRYRFGVALFDGTSTDHHIVRDTQVLELLVPASPEIPPPAPFGRDPGPEGEGIL